MRNRKQSTPRRDPFVVKQMSAEVLVVEFERFVTSIALRVRRQFNLTADTRELVACGFLGLLEAHRRFDPKHGTLFATFAYYSVRGKILDASRRQHWGDSRALQCALALNDTLERRVLVPRHPAERPAGALPTPIIYLFGDIDDAAVSDPARQLDELEHAELLARLQAEIQLLPNAERRVMQHVLAGSTMDEISIVLGRSVSWVSRAKARAIRLLRERLVEITSP